MAEHDLRALYLEWKAARDRRRNQGLQRPGCAEVTALERVLAARENLSDDQWNGLVRDLESHDGNLCSCGHHLALHHDRTGSCFQVIGCATACSCGEAAPRK